MLSKEDRILIKGYDAKKNYNWISPKTNQLILLIVNPVDYAIWGILQERVYDCQIGDINHVKELLLIV